MHNNLWLKDKSRALVSSIFFHGAFLITVLVEILRYAVVLKLFHAISLPFFKENAKHFKGEK
jgi:hypothetical protein